LAFQNQPHVELDKITTHLQFAKKNPYAKSIKPNSTFNL